MERLLVILREWDPGIEIVVADHASTDQTTAIAEAHECLSTVGGLPGLGRNRGANATSGRYLLFVDADVLPTGEALEEVRRLVRQGTVGVVGFLHVPLTDDRPIRIFYWLADIWFRLVARTRSKQALASFLLVRRDCFELLDGFDTGLDPGEDVDFVRRAARVAEVQYRNEMAVHVSARRFSTEPKYWFALKTTVWGILRFLGIRSNVLSYRWIQHDPGSAAEEERWLRRRLKYEI